MTIAELFVKIGVTGTSETNKQLKESTNVIGELRSGALAAKAAIIGAVYAFEQFTAASIKEGVGLAHFTRLTGESSKELQQWQAEGRKFGVAAEEIEGAFMSIYNAVNNAELTGQSTFGLQALSKYVKDFDPQKLKDTGQAMLYFRELAHNAPRNISHAAFQSMGLSGNIEQLMYGSTGDISRNAVGMSDAAARALEIQNEKWTALFRKIQLQFNAFTIKHGDQIITDISDIADAIIDLVDAFAGMDDKLKLFETLGDMLKGVANTIRIISEVVDHLNGRETPNGILGLTNGSGPQNADQGRGFLSRMFGPQYGPLAMSNFEFNPNHPNFTVAPDMSDWKRVGNTGYMAPGQGVVQNNYFQGKQDHKEVQDATFKGAVKGVVAAAKSGAQKN